MSDLLLQILGGLAGIALGAALLLIFYMFKWFDDGGP